MRGLGRKLRQTFGISAPRMAVRTHLSWRWKVPALLLSLGLIAGMWWWGFDFGQILGGFNRSAVAEKQAQLETDLNITRGSQATLTKQSLELQSENTQIKEELAFLQKLSSDSGKQGTITIQRMSA